MLRDFIYLDADRLYSLYSQVFEGVAEEIVQSYVKQLSAKAGNRSLVPGRETAETTAVDGKHTTESRLLYDHMYSQLESELAGRIVDASGVAAAGRVDLLSAGMMVRVNGTAEVEDLTRLRRVIRSMNELGEALAYLQTRSPQGVVTGDSATTSARAPARKGQSEPNAKAEARTLGLQFDAGFLKRADQVSEFFGADLTAVLISSPGVTGETRFRTIVDPRWMRSPPEILRALYAGQPAERWIAVGFITYVPDKAADVEALASSDLSMRDVLRNMARATAKLDKIGYESAGQPEIIMIPLAIYRDITLLPEDAPATDTAPADVIE